MSDNWKSELRDMVLLLLQFVLSDELLLFQVATPFAARAGGRHSVTQAVRFVRKTARRCIAERCCDCAQETSLFTA
jgi:hypothetical protein